MQIQRTILYLAMRILTVFTVSSYVTLSLLLQSPNSSSQPGIVQEERKCQEVGISRGEHKDFFSNCPFGDVTVQ